LFAPYSFHRAQLASQELKEVHFPHGEYHSWLLFVINRITWTVVIFRTPHVYFATIILKIYGEVYVVNIKHVDSFVDVLQGLIVVYL